MESTDELKIAKRREAFFAWLAMSLNHQSLTVNPMPGDASFRYYSRIYTGSTSFVAMDAPPPENCQAFVAISRALREMGLNTPEIIAADLNLGFLLLTDFGDDTFLKTLSNENVECLYESALQALARLKNCNDVQDHSLPLFTADFMQKEWAWHKEWFLEKWLGLGISRYEKELDASFTFLADQAAKQPQVFMHRDYHSANLMVLPEGGVGILDFQDAFIGPITYDLVSLLRDCYIAWPKEQVKKWALRYREILMDQGQLHKTDEATFLHWFDWMGLERHLKALFTFARKAVRDHDEKYLKHIPRTLNYVQEVSASYAELSSLHAFYTQVVPPALSRKLTICAP